MLLVLARRRDSPAREFVAGLTADATLLTCDDLSVKGWRYAPGDQVGTLVASGKQLMAAEVDGVLTRLPLVAASELAAIAASDRDYVAAEMTAFLAAWLSELSCPVLNRPTPLCLMGPPLRREEWVHLAAGLGVPVAPALRSVPGAAGTGPSGGGAASGSVVVSVVGRRCVGETDQSLRAAALAIAETAGVNLLRAVFAGPEDDAAFLGADYWPDVSDPGVAAAVTAYFTDGPGR